MSVLKRYRGDTDKIGVQLSSKGAPINLTGCSLMLSVSAVSNPKSSTEIIQQTTATLDDDPSTGKAYFEFDPGDWDFIGTYYYDIQLTYADGTVKTVTKSHLTIEQDITK